MHAIQEELYKPLTEDTWPQHEAALRQLIGVVRGGACAYTSFVPTVKSLHDQIEAAISTERTVLSATATELIETLARQLRHDFAPLVDVYVPPVHKLTARTNKIFVNRAAKVLVAVIEETQLTTCWPYLCDGVKSINKNMRGKSMDLVVLCLDKWSTDVVANLGLDKVELALSDGMADPAPEVRESARKGFGIYTTKFPEHKEAMLDRLPANVKKYLVPAAKPQPIKKPRIPIKKMAVAAVDVPVIIMEPKKPEPEPVKKPSPVAVAKEIHHDTEESSKRRTSARLQAKAVTSPVAELPKPAKPIVKASKVAFSNREPTKAGKPPVSKRRSILGGRKSLGKAGIRAGATKTDAKLFKVAVPKTGGAMLAKKRKSIKVDAGVSRRIARKSIGRPKAAPAAPPKVRAMRPPPSNEPKPPTRSTSISKPPTKVTKQQGILTSLRTDATKTSNGKKRTGDDDKNTDTHKRTVSTSRLYAPTASSLARQVTKQ